MAQRCCKYQNRFGGLAKDVTGVHILSYETGTLVLRSVVAAHDTGLSTNCCLLNVEDLATNQLVLVATGAKFGVVLGKPNNLTAAQADLLRATDCTRIHKHEHRSPTLHLGLNLTFR